MSELTADNIFSQIVQLPSSELTRLRRMLDQMDQTEQNPFEPPLAHQEKAEKKPIMLQLTPMAHICLLLHKSKIRTRRHTSDFES
jgi:hypothetical protein